MPYLFEIVGKANYLQDKYNFVAVPKPGGNNLVSVQTMDQSPQNSLVLAGTGFVTGVYEGKLNQANYYPLTGMGTACWMLISNRGDQKTGVASLRGEKKLAMGIPGPWAHMMGLELTEKVNKDILIVPFKSNGEIMTLILGDGSINLIMDNPKLFKNYKQKDSRLQGLGLQCLRTLPDFPDIKTLAEQGINAPNLWFTITASTLMPEIKRKEIQRILDLSLIAMGQQEIFEKYSMIPPTLVGKSTQQDFQENQTKFTQALKKFDKQLKQ